MASQNKKFMRVKRIVKELKELEKNTNYDIYLEESGEFDTVRVVMPGPSESLFEGGYYVIRIHFGPEYPYKSPSVGILNKIYHPNVDWGSGSVCLNALNHDWKECYTLYQMMTTLLPFLLRTPNGSDPLNQEAGLLCERCPDKYALHVKEVVNKYALLHQLEPVLKGCQDWRTKRPYDSKSSLLAKKDKETSTPSPPNPSDISHEKSATATSSTDSSKRRMMEVEDSDGIDDDALLDSSDSEREENKRKKNTNDKNKDITPSVSQKENDVIMGDLSRSANAGQNKDAQQQIHDEEKEKQSASSNMDCDAIVTKGVESICIDTRSASPIASKRNRTDSDEPDLPPPINTQQFNQWWSRSSSSASFSSFDLRKCSTEDLESHDHEEDDGDDCEMDHNRKEMEYDYNRSTVKVNRHLLASKSACNSPELSTVNHNRGREHVLQIANRGKSTRKSLTRRSSEKRQLNAHNRSSTNSRKPPPPSYPKPKNLDESDKFQEHISGKIRDQQKEYDKMKEMEWSDTASVEDDDNDLSSLDEDPISCVERQKEMETLMRVSSHSISYASGTSISPFLTPMYSPLHRREQTERHTSMTPQPLLPHSRYESMHTLINNEHYHDTPSSNHNYQVFDRKSISSQTLFSHRAAKHKHVEPHYGSPLPNKKHKNNYGLSSPDLTSQQNMRHGWKNQQ